MAQTCVHLRISVSFSDRCVHHQDARGDQCDVCARTLDAIDLINPRCLISREHTVTTKSSAHMYVKLDVLQPKTEAWVKRRWALGKWSPNAVINHEGEIVDARMRSGLRPSPVTRDLTWGVPVPTVDNEDDHGMKGKVLCECFCVYVSAFRLMHTPFPRCLGV